MDENINHLDLHSFSVNNIDEYELEEIEIKQVYVDDRPEMSIAFDVLVKASMLCKNMISIMTLMIGAISGLDYAVRET